MRCQPESPTSATANGNRSRIDPIVSPDRLPIAPTVALRVRCGALLRWTTTVGQCPQPPVKRNSARTRFARPSVADTPARVSLDPIGSTTEPLPAPTVFNASSAVGEGVRRHLCADRGLRGLVILRERLCPPLLGESLAHSSRRPCLPALPRRVGADDLPRRFLVDQGQERQLAVARREAEPLAAVPRRDAEQSVGDRPRPEPGT